MLLSTFTQVLQFTKCLHFATLYFHSTLFWRQILHLSTTLFNNISYWLYLRLHATSEPNELFNVTDLINNQTKKQTNTDSNNQKHAEYQI